MRRAGRSTRCSSLDLTSSTKLHTRSALLKQTHPRSLHRSSGSATSVPVPLCPMRPCASVMTLCALPVARRRPALRPAQREQHGRREAHPGRAGRPRAVAVLRAYMWPRCRRARHAVGMLCTCYRQLGVASRQKWKDSTVHLHICARLHVLWAGSAAAIRPLRRHRAARVRRGALGDRGGAPQARAARRPEAPPPRHRRLGTAASAPPPRHRRLGTAASAPPPRHRRLGTAASAPPPRHRCRLGRPSCCCPLGYCPLGYPWGLGRK